MPFVLLCNYGQIISVSFDENAALKAALMSSIGTFRQQPTV